MKRAEFVEKAGWNVGVSEKKAEAWCDEHPKGEYTDDDLNELYYWDRSAYVGDGTYQEIAVPCGNGWGRGKTTRYLHGDGGREGNR